MGNLSLDSKVGKGDFSFIERLSVAWSSMSKAVGGISIRGVVITGMLLLTVFVSAIGVVYSSHLSRQLFAEQSILQGRNDQLQLEWAQLLLEQGAWSSPGRIESVAHEDLQMSLPRAEQVELIY